MTKKQRIKKQRLLPPCLHCELSKVLMAYWNEHGPEPAHVLHALAEVVADVLASGPEDQVEAGLEHLNEAVLERAKRLQDNKTVGHA